MSTKEIEAAALKLLPKQRARLAEKLLKSLEALSDEENEIIWAEEAERRDAAWLSADSGRTAKRVLRSAREKLRILAIMNFKRRPTYWVGRSQELLRYSPF